MVAWFVVGEFKLGKFWLKRCEGGAADSSFKEDFACVCVCVCVCVLGVVGVRG